MGFLVSLRMALEEGSLLVLLAEVDEQGLRELEFWIGHCMEES